MIGVKSYSMVPHSIIQISHSLGSDELICQGGGGNISLKDSASNSFWIKASGKWLSHANQENIFVELDLIKAKNWLASNQNTFPIDWQKSPDNGHSLRASIETSLHLLFDKAVVVHTHPVSVLTFAVQKDSSKLFSELLGDLNWAFIPYEKPGRQLTERIKNHPKFGKCSIFILQNHGLVVAADTTNEASDITLKVIQKTAMPIRNDLTDFHRPKVSKSFLNQLGYKFPNNPLIHSLACDPLNFSSFSRSNNVLYPDQVVFLGKNATIIDSFDDAANSKNLPFIVIPKVGVFMHHTASSMVEVMLKCHAEILSRIPLNGQLNYLSDSAINDLMNWDAEIYRQSVN